MSMSASVYCVYVYYVCVYVLCLCVLCLCLCTMRSRAKGLTSLEDMHIHIFVDCSGTEGSSEIALILKKSIVEFLNYPCNSISLKLYQNKIR